MGYALFLLTISAYGSLIMARLFKRFMFDSWIKYFKNL